MTAGPPLAQTLCLLLLAAVLLAVGLRTDWSGRLISGPAMVIAGVLGVRDLLLRPALVANAEGLRVVWGLRRVSVGWQDVQRLRLQTDRRTPLLEIDLGDSLILLARTRLGRPPAAVLAELQELSGRQRTGPQHHGEDEQQRDR